MVIAGLKLTHDGSIAVIDNGKLEFCIEMEKINNNARHSEILDLTIIPKLLSANGYDLDAVDHIAVDGWHGEGNFWSGAAVIRRSNGGDEFMLEVAPYNEKSLKENILTRFFHPGALKIGEKTYGYSSYMHVAGHVLSAYTASPFPGRGESSFILTWDGGQYPRLYYFDAAGQHLENLGHLFGFLGTIYSIFPQYFGPYRKSTEELEKERKEKQIEGFFGGYTVAGKLMAYIAKGKAREELYKLFDEVYKSNFVLSNEFEHIFSSEVRKMISPAQITDEDALASMHYYLQRLLVVTLADKINKYPNLERNLCFVGGSALNIKWNNAIRDSGHFKDVFVPPFPNDSGSAIGVAACEYVHQMRDTRIGWNVYSGPRLSTGDTPIGWTDQPCDVRNLARLLHETGEPVVVLHGRAELGPRALGNRSILASPADHRMKDLLNQVKSREDYRPVAPICLESFAESIFNPGCPDRYMLFEHDIRAEWRNRVPAICHIDGTARLQTVNADSNPVIFELLTCFHELSGLPVLCNTSANHNGKGFFPNVASAAEWGKVNYIWSENILYAKINKTDFGKVLSANVVSQS